MERLQPPRGKYVNAILRGVQDALNTDVRAQELVALVGAAYAALKREQYKPHDDFSKSIDACYEAVRERVKAGGPSWKPK